MYFYSKKSESEIIIVIKCDTHFSEQRKMQKIQDWNSMKLSSKKRKFITDEKDDLNGNVNKIE